MNLTGQEERTLPDYQRGNFRITFIVALIIVVGVLLWAWAGTMNTEKLDVNSSGTQVGPAGQVRVNNSGPYERSIDADTFSSLQALIGKGSDGYRYMDSTGNFHMTSEE